MPALRNRKFDCQYGSYLVGESMRSISKRMGLHTTAVSRAFKRRGFKKRSPWIADEEQRELIKVMYGTGDYFMWELAICFGYKSYMSISQIVNDVQED